MKVLVTGGAGFIGSHLVEALLSGGHQVVTIDDLSAGSERVFFGEASRDGHIFVQGKVEDRRLMEELMQSVDLVVHLAAVLGVKTCVENPLKVIEGNLDGTRNVLELALANQVKVVFASTSEIYGKSEQLPYKEDSDRVLGSTFKNRWCYATAKALEEHLCVGYAGRGLAVTIARYFNAYGPRAASSPYGNVIPKFITAALRGEPIPVYGDGTQSRCFTYIDDTIRGTLLSMEARHNGEVFNIGSNQSVTIMQLAQKIKILTGSDSPIVRIPYREALGEHYEDTPNRIPDLTKSSRVLGFSPSVELEEGLLRTIAWYRARQEDE
ncbi:UDP-glucose 4-epimerase [Paenibacillus sp. J31TS4]|uniref:NAD-dependent epimerase/dehydratase family protein n=1 Tax=Paenibacillus sp. J31TS4 TaxID=2807195 RepID=UPI001B2E4078|nr:NAD-dependent epimerase/dehydratase family protein [Paenibacillus sp. J31TS4]GIP39130.1 UDP-glucose 4-epimerase [Paenibacillus sp. J31TS4]